MKLSALLLAACLTSTAAGAATIQFQFTGTVDQVEGPAQSEFSVGEAVTATFGPESRFYFVFHGGSGSELSEIHEALDHGVVKMNVDTDMQYAFTRAIADHCFRHYDGVLHVDGALGSKKAYDPRTYLAAAEAAMAERVKRAAVELRSAGTAAVMA